MGCCPGIGTTHLSISLCNYCASKLGKKTAYIEFHKREEISQLFLEQPCQLHGVDYFPVATSDEVPALLNGGYQYLIFDMGTFGEADFQEFLRCDRKVLVGSLAPWKSNYYQDFFLYSANTTYLGEGLKHFVQMGSAKEIKRFLKKYGVSKASIHQLPFIKNPFCIEAAQFLFFQELLSD